MCGQGHSAENSSGLSFPEGGLNPGIRKLLPSWLPKDVLTLGPLSAPGVPDTHSHPQLSPSWVPFSFGLLHAELWIVWGCRQGVPSRGPCPLPLVLRALLLAPLQVPHSLGLVGGEDGWLALAWGLWKEPGEGLGRERQLVSPGMEVAAFPAPCDLADICSKSRSRQAEPSCLG